MQRNCFFVFRASSFVCDWALGGPTAAARTERGAPDADCPAMASGVPLQSGVFRAQRLHGERATVGGSDRHQACKTRPSAPWVTAKGTIHPRPRLERRLLEIPNNWARAGKADPAGQQGAFVAAGAAGARSCSFWWAVKTTAAAYRTSRSCRTNADHGARAYASISRRILRSGVLGGFAWLSPPARFDGAICFIGRIAMAAIRAADRRRPERNRRALPPRARSLSPLARAARAPMHRAEPFGCPGEAQAIRRGSAPMNRASARRLARRRRR